MSLNLAVACNLIKTKKKLFFSMPDWSDEGSGNVLWIQHFARP